MSDINTTIFTGRIVRDPELQTTATGLSVCTFNIAVEKGYGENKKVVYPTIVAWKGTAEFVSKLRKGTKVAVAAEYDERSWQTKGGDKRKAYEFNAVRVTAMEPKSVTTDVVVDETPTAASAGGFEEILSDEQLPF